MVAVIPSGPQAVLTLRPVKASITSDPLHSILDRDGTPGVGERQGACVAEAGVKNEEKRLLSRFTRAIMEVAEVDPSAKVAGTQEEEDETER